MKLKRTYSNSDNKYKFAKILLKKLRKMLFQFKFKISNPKHLYNKKTNSAKELNKLNKAVL